MGYCINCGEFPSDSMGYGLCVYCEKAKREKNNNKKRFNLELTNNEILDLLYKNKININYLIK